MLFWIDIGLFYRLFYNYDSQEVEAVTAKKEELVKEYDTKLDEYAALLDIRANRIKVDFGDTLYLNLQ